MNREYLKWDSDFFGFEIDKITLKEPVSYNVLEQEKMRSKAKVIYIFTPNNFSSEEQSILREIGAIKYDTKIIFGKKPEEKQIHPFIAQVYAITPEIEELAYAAGWKSRYNIDPNFHPYFKKLYSIWIKKAFTESSSIVLSCCDQNRVVGIVTISLGSEIGQIGLVAVAADCRGRGVGRQLLNAVDAYCFNQNIECCRVATQEENTIACNLYKKHGYKTIGKEAIWHLWK